MSSTPGPPGFESRLSKPRHITYWKRCLKTYLPSAYTSADANRMMLAYFTISALDLLDALDASLTHAERQDCLDWVYLCQHPDGGFRGSPGIVFAGRENEQSRAWDVASGPATLFALSILASLRDDFARVKRKECLRFLNKLQRPDGSFGEHLGERGEVEGGMDTRFAFCVAGCRWMLRGRVKGEVEGVPDIDVKKLLGCIKLAQTFDGGISDVPFHEPHGGYTYCALSALALLDALPNDKSPNEDSHFGLSDIEHTTRWLLSRQTTELEDGMSDDDSDAKDVNHILQWAGFNGRCNKPADTCYTWWIGGSLKILGKLHLSDIALSRNYLYDKTQHAIGGFGKKVGDPPDIYHSSLGLAALSLLGEPGLQPIDPSLCLSVRACRHIQENAVWNNAKDAE